MKVPRHSRTSGYDQPMNRTYLAAAALGLTILTGCGSQPTNKATDAPAVPSTTTVTAVTIACPDGGTLDPDLTAAAGTGKLRDGSKIYSSQQVSNTTDRSKIDVVFRICGTTTTDDPLKVVANDIALKLKGSPLGSKVATMRVTNTSGGSAPGARVRCEDFQLHTFAGVAGTERATWKTLSEK